MIKTLPWLGLPYKGSKRRYVQEYVNFALGLFPKTKYVYDLFGGGGAVSLAFLQAKQIKKVFYNELDSSVASFLKKVVEEDITKEETAYEFISREKFKKFYKGSDWYAGFLKTCWSFGSRGETYAYSPLNELKARRCYEDVLKASKILGKDLNKSRLSVLILRTKKDKDSTKIPPLERIQALERIQDSKKIIDYSKLVISNASYIDVPLLAPAEETLLFLDPPYFGTDTYTEKFDQKKFIGFLGGLKLPFLLCEYRPLPGLTKVHEIKTRSTLSSTNNSKVCYERLFTKF